MNQDNLRSLYAQLAAAGFGDELNDKLRDTVGNGRKLFGLSYGTMYPVKGSVPGDPQTHDVMVFELYFKQHAQPGTYCFEGYNARLYAAGSAGAFSCWYDPGSMTINQAYRQMKEDLGSLLTSKPVIAVSDKRDKRTPLKRSPVGKIRGKKR